MDCKFFSIVIVCKKSFHKIIPIHWFLFHLGNDFKSISSPVKDEVLRNSNKLMIEIAGMVPIQFTNLTASVSAWC